MANVVRQSLPSTAKVIVDSRKRNALRKIPGSSSIAGLRKGLTGRTKRQVLYDFSTCAVVGNGGAMKSREFGHAIESHKTVFRLNQAPTKGYEKHVGKKTTFRLINKLWVRKYMGASSYLPLSMGTTLLLARSNNPSDMLQMAQAHRSRSGVHVAKSSLEVAMASRSIFNAFKRQLECRGKYKSQGGDTPTTGMYALVVALTLCDKVSVYGFGNSPGGAYQYYVLKGTERSKGNPVHSFNVEKTLVQQLHNEGLLNFCTEKSRDDCGYQGEKTSKSRVNVQA
eukprot:CAMPEP_0117665694 /NCGR_PEP_ID=MMETSP0804-20121206/9958_1 /TAXON_ID=1074897 /ORGANISM="Tetraselmis astigmatica, Strain CCMP880" /LENGTH=281 /DNA_ID=CAMNT_0005473147 /DNA_START=351 /DNA_END=1196 /DNA_ORIENTATION=+